MFRLSFFILFCLFGTCIQAQTNYPVPPKSDKMLFYLQRSHNKNTVIYDLNITSNGKLNTDEPVNAYWIRFEEGGQKAELTFLQQRAFGVSCKIIDKAKESYKLNFNKFNKRDIYLIKTSAGNFKAFVNINNELAELENVYIKSENNSLGIPLKFKYIDFYGFSVKNRKKVTERLLL